MNKKKSVKRGLLQSVCNKRKQWHQRSSRTYSNLDCDPLKVARIHHHLSLKFYFIFVLNFCVIKSICNVITSSLYIDVSEIRHVVNKIRYLNSTVASLQGASPKNSNYCRGSLSDWATPRSTYALQLTYNDQAAAYKDQPADYADNHHADGAADNGCGFMDDHE